MQKHTINGEVLINFGDDSDDDAGDAGDHAGDAGDHDDEDEAWSALETNWGAGAVWEGCHPHPTTPKPSDGDRKQKSEIRWR